MLLSHNQIKALVNRGVVEHAKEEAINAASLDIHLGDTILTEARGKLLDYRRRDAPDWQPIVMHPEGGYILAPGEFILAHSIEIFNLPNNISAEYKLKSSMARIGLDHLNAGWCDAGWHGSVLTLELKNCSRNHEIIIQAGDLIGQVIFFSHEEVPDDKSYAVRGRYNNDKSVSGAKKKSRSIIYGDRDEEASQEEYEKEHPAVEITMEPPRRVIDISELREIIEGESEDKV